jgi:prepilin-type N-terminal cleavage/methylation domain-containing protein
MTGWRGDCSLFRDSWSESTCGLSKAAVNRSRLRAVNQECVSQPNAVVKTMMQPYQVKPESGPACCVPRPVAGFTLAEVVICIAIIAVVFGTVLLAYNQATWRAEWSGYSLAAQSLATQQIEQARAAVWDPGDTQGQPPGGKNELTNLTLSGRSVSGGVVKGYTTAILDLPISTNAGPVWATNYVSIKTISPIFGGAAFNLAPVQMVRVDTVWPFRIGNTNRLYTNSVSTYFGPDNRAASSL